MTSMVRPDFMDSPYFVMEFDNWHLLPDAPPEVVKEFDEWMAAYDEASGINKQSGGYRLDDSEQRNYPG